MVEALIRGERNPEVLADLARGRMRAKRPALVQALTGAFDDHHAELARILLGQIDTLTRQIDHLAARIDQLIAELPGTDPDDADPGTVSTSVDSANGQDRADDAPIRPRRPDPVPYARAPGLLGPPEPAAGPSGPKRRGGKTSRGNPYLKGVLSTAAAAASRTTTFLGERFTRIVKRRGKGRALIAMA